jgi:hypothetical protein
VLTVRDPAEEVAVIDGASAALPPLYGGVVKPLEARDHGVVLRGLDQLRIALLPLVRRIQDDVADPPRRPDGALRIVAARPRPQVVRVQGASHVAE